MLIIAFSFLTHVNVTGIDIVIVIDIVSGIQSDPHILYTGIRRIILNKHTMEEKEYKKIIIVYCIQQTIHISPQLILMHFV